MGVDKYVGSSDDLDAGEPGVEFLMANRFIKNINLCMRGNPDKPILIHLKSCGGDWTEGMAIYDVIKACPVPVTLLNYTHARSMTSLIFQAGNKRVMMPHSYFLFHDGTLVEEGTTKQVYSSIDFHKKTSEIMLNIYINAMKNTPTSKVKHWSDKKLRNWLITQMDKKEDVYLDAEQAIYYGFADEIFGQNGYDWAGLVEYTEEQLSR